MSSKLSEKEYKKLVIEIAVHISPVIIDKKLDSITAADQIAVFAKDIANAVNLVLENQIKKDYIN
ncbi:MULTISPECIES: hypothetical protein [unclassified Polaribacter]|uniref:hypothetical protein n=1 Tax=unclassified Polaribacter TaxID=196858 RepID=UPI0011BED386|nr:MULTISPECIES: hypothetical protein [unclassified Polaribacter]TXD52211.1 hypothetical protein ES043_09005 [Polaribacter sp. IC063]TXD60075.1 hypothetical protein ES044_08295 [Polaribacter sp. IC066]